jgi:hypothetical protein
MKRSRKSRVAGVRKKISQTLLFTNYHVPICCQRRNRDPNDDYIVNRGKSLCFRHAHTPVLSVHMRGTDFRVLATRPRMPHRQQRANGVPIHMGESN